MSFWEKAIDLLDENNSAEYYIENIKKEYAHIHDALMRKTPVVICGNSPYARQVSGAIRKEYGSTVIIVDNDPEDNPNGDILTPDFLGNSPEDYVYISASSVFLGFYLKKLMSRSLKNIIPYHALPIIDRKLDGVRKAYTHDFFLRGMRNIIENRGLYKKLLDSLADEESVRILARLICYRLTAESGAAFGVQSEGDIYFDHEFLPRGENEVFVDAGGCDGDTLEAFLERYGSFRKYLFFEPESVLLETARSKFQDKRIEYFNIGLYDRNGKSRFEPNGFGMGKIAGDGDAVIKTRRLDEIAPGEATFIKLDVEGAELAALRGAESTITGYKPKLAVSVYHEPEDILELSSYLRKLVPEYRLYLRCAFESLYNDMVLFAVI